jgi:hypothetical protein
MLHRVGLPIVLALVLAACGTDGQDSEGRSQATTPTQPPVASLPALQNRLVFRRVDGSEIEMSGRPIAWCGPDDSIPGTVLQVAAIMGLKRTEDEWFSYWHVWAIPADVAEGKPISFPPPRAWGDERGVQIFVGDSATENEASTSGEDSGGEIVFSQASCKVGAPIEFTVDAVIDSEFFDGDPVKAEGTFRGVLEPPPEGYY